jgi:serine/threonine-protein phosphatase 2A regulatory subunit A
MIQDIHPIALLKDSLRSEDTEVRLKALGRLRSVAAALGAERTKVELLPYLLGTYACLWS